MIGRIAVVVALVLGVSGVASGQEQQLSVEIELGPPLPTHWVASEPVGNGAGAVSDAMLREAPSDPSRWLLYGGNYRNYRHSPLKSLNPESVRDLRVAWALPTGTTGQFEVSPVVYDGVMYVTTSYNRLFALDAKTGEMLWRYDHEQPPLLRICCGPVNRGVAIGGDLVMMATLDAKLIAFQRRTGEIAWSVEIASYEDGYSATSAPLVVGDLAVIGIAGGEYGVRGFFDAYEVSTGKRVWRHYTVPADGEPGTETWAGDSYKSGGSPAWTSGAYDVESDTLYWTTGNPSPDWNGDLRMGDNLYSNSLLAVEMKTGKRKWHFQFTPHDVWDYDGNTQVFLVDVERDGRTVKAVAHSGSQRLLLPDRSGERRVPAGRALRRAGYLGDHRRRGSADRESRGAPEAGAHRARLPEQHGRDERRVDGRLQPGSRARIHPRRGGLPAVREGHRGLHQGHPLPRRHARDRRCDRGQSLRSSLGHRRRHGKDSLAT